METTNSLTSNIQIPKPPPGKKQVNITYIIQQCNHKQQENKPSNQHPASGKQPGQAGYPNESFEPLQMLSEATKFTVMSSLWVSIEPKKVNQIKPKKFAILQEQFPERSMLHLT